MPADKPSTVLAFTEGEIRLMSLGLYALRPDLDEPPASHLPLQTRLHTADKVFRERDYLKRTERELAGPSEDSRSPLLRERESKTVQVRLRLQELQLAVTGLQAFLERENPTVDAFSKADPKPLIDPPEKVRPLLRRLESAVELCKREDALPAVELALLD